jgi:tRNA (adenine37-N6)-methyltransferase
MENHDFSVKPIGIIRTPHKIPSETPIQPVFSQGIRGSVLVDAQYTDGLLDLDQFSHIILIYYFHRSKGAKLVLKPYLQDQEHGIFATRAPHRPNPIGFSLVKLIAVEKNILHIEDVDILDETPLLDIKPYVKRFDSRDNVRSGWQDQVRDDDAQIRGRREFDG